MNDDQVKALWSALTALEKKVEKLELFMNRWRSHLAERYRLLDP